MVSSARAVIFDVDGVLVDSYDAHFQSYLRLGAQYDLSMSRELFAANFGRTTRETIVEVWGGARWTSQQIAHMDEQKESFYREILKEEFSAMEGAAGLIVTLRAAGFRLAVGSSGPLENVDLVLGQLQVNDQLQAKVTGRDVTCGKPDPQVFLMGSQRLGVPPARCVVIEDAAAGVAAARSAGMASIGLVSTGRTRDELRDADLVVDSLCELSPAVIEGLLTD